MAWPVPWRPPLVGVVETVGRGVDDGVREDAAAVATAETDKPGDKLLSDGLDFPLVMRRFVCSRHSKLWNSAQF